MKQEGDKQISNKSITQNEYRLEVLRQRYSLFKVIAGTGLAGLVAVVLPFVIEYSKISLDERKSDRDFVKEYIEVLEKDYGAQIALVTYFSEVLPNKSERKLWANYRTYLFGVRDKRNEVVQEIQSIKPDNIENQKRLIELETKLSNLEEKLRPPVPIKKAPMSFFRVPADQYRDGRDRIHLREDVAEAYKEVFKKVHQSGAILTSSGAKRSLHTRLISSRSAVSLHYLGRELDLFVGSGMENPRRDPYVIVKDGYRYWRVYARAEKGTEMTLQAITYRNRNSESAREVKGKFIDLTAFFKEFGFERQPARKSFFTGGSWLGANWWSFRWTEGLVKGKTTFGEELLKVYTEDELSSTQPWKSRERVWGVDWF